MPAIKAIVFDLDDTLYPERAYVFSGFDAVANGMTDVLGDPEATVARMKSLFDGEQRPRVFDVLLTERGLPDRAALVSRMIDIYRDHAPVLDLYPDADTALDRLRDRFKLGLITDGRSAQQWAKIRALRLRKRLDAIIVTDDLGPGFGKPSRVAFERMVRQLDAEPGACVYVADNPAKDFVAPNALGWRTVQIVRPDGLYGDPSSLSERTATFDGPTSYDAPNTSPTVDARHRIATLGVLDDLLV